jgi:hypothetical protein
LAEAKEENPPHIERLLNILRSSSQTRLPEQIKKSMEFNPVLGKYLGNYPCIYLDRF